MAKKKYVVWVGRQPGIYDTWAECQSQTSGFSGAKFKAFPANDAAKAFAEGVGSDPTSDKASGKSAGKTAIPTYECLTVDAAFSSKSKIMEWRGVMNVSKDEVFRSKPYIGGSANIGEFLALIQGIQYLRATGQTNLAIFSDSQTAMVWLRNGKCNTTIGEDILDPEVVQQLKDAETYLSKHSLQDIRLHKWDTPKWKKEIPADFGRK